MSARLDDKQYLSLVVDEIEISDKSRVSKKGIRDLLDSFLKSDTTFSGYGIVEFGDTFTVGIVTDSAKAGMLACEFCDYFTPYQAELHTHRMTHIAGFR